MSEDIIAVEIKTDQITMRLFGLPGTAREYFGRSEQYPMTRLDNETYGRVVGIHKNKQATLVKRFMKAAKE